MKGLNLSERNNQQPSSALRPLNVRLKEAQYTSQDKDTSFSETTNFLQNLRATRFESNCYLVYELDKIRHQEAMAVKPAVY